jgi:GNAT superfamily N-acetyltransferase
MPTTFFSKICFMTLVLTSYCYSSERKDLSFNETHLGYLAGEKVTLSCQDKEVGHLRYLKLPLLQWYTLYYFHVNPENRNNGYGRYLFQHVMDKVNNLGATKVMLQTGPYEYDDKGEAEVIPAGRDRDERVKKLLRFYSSFGFKPLNKFLATLLGGLYTVCQIHEDSSIFMTMNPKQGQS